MTTRTSGGAGTTVTGGTSGTPIAADLLIVQVVADARAVPLDAPSLDTMRLVDDGTIRALWSYRQSTASWQGIVLTADGVRVGAANVGAGTGTLKYVATPSVNLTLPSVASSLAGLAVPETWTAAQTFATGSLLVAGAGAGVATLAYTATPNVTLTFPSIAGGVLAVSNQPQTFTGAQTFATATLLVAGAGAGVATLAYTATPNVTITFPSATTVLGGLAAAQTWTAIQTFATGTLVIGGSGAGVATLVYNAAPNSNITFSGASHTVAGLSIVQTWSAAQTFPSGASGFILSDATDPTKLTNFDISNQTTGTTRTITIIGNGATTLANLSSPQTFSGNVKTFTGGVTITTTDLTVTDRNVVLSATTGTQFGTAVGQKLAFHGSAAVAQRAGAAQAAAAATGSTAVTPFGYTTAAQADAIVTLVNELRAALVEKGIIKGSA